MTAFICGFYFRVIGFSDVLRQHATFWCRWNKEPMPIFEKIVILFCLNFKDIVNSHCISIILERIEGIRSLQMACIGCIGCIVS